jgi:3-methyladenine DNA glycosylase AlkD
MTAKEIRRELKKLADPVIAEHSQRFFKTGPGQYGEGDRFLGIRVPRIRAVAKQGKGLPLDEVIKLLKSKWHEERFCAVVILTLKFKGGGPNAQKAIYDLYLASTPWINNWDLIDVSAHLIVGPYLQDRSRKALTQLAKSDNLWKRRIAMMSTYHYIKQDDFAETLAIAEILLHDEHDLIHKITGWMLREVGKRDQSVEEEFLQEHYRSMPRTMLRYAIEKFDEPLRQRYLKGEIST